MKTRGPVTAGEYAAAIKVSRLRRGLLSPDALAVAYMDKDRKAIKAHKAALQRIAECK